MTELIRKQAERNVQSRDNFESSAPHRQRVTEEILRGFCPGDRARLCILGAGNCNDVDLPALCEVFAEVHLVDVDGEALAEGVARQAPSHRERITTHAGVDLTGMLNELSPDLPPDGAIRLLHDYHPTDLPGPFDMVVSTCLLSQLIEAVVTTYTENDKQLLDLVTAVRRQHIRLMLELTAPGRYGLLVFDFVSSDTVPKLAEATADQLPMLAALLAAHRNHFHGCNPPAVASVFDKDPVFPGKLAGFQLLKPWLWNHGARQYAVAAIKYKMK